MDPRSASRGLSFRACLVLATAIALAWLGGCSDNPGGPCSSCPPPAQGLIVSNPIPAIGVASGTALVRVNRALAPSAGGSVVYVSLPPGTIPKGGLATIRNVRTGSAVPAAMADGGFDPVSIDARPGDTLAVTVELVGGASRSFLFTVRATRPPVVVRTDPPPRKRDVPLNASLVVVFSEPIDPSTIGGIRLLKGGAAVGGHAVLSADGLRATFQADQNLSPNADYELSISTDLKDLSGDRLEQPVQVAFTTGTTVAVAWIATQQAALFTNPFNGELRTFNTSAIRYADGRVSGYFDIFYPRSGSLTAGQVTCFTIVNGTAAWVAGVLEMDPDSLGRVYEYGWRAVDRGPPEGGVPDQLSLAFPLDTNSLGTAQDFCAAAPTTGSRDGEIALYDVVSGNIVIATGDVITPPPPPPPPANGVSQIAFASGAYPGAPSGGIKVMGADGSYVRTLTSAVGDWSPAWSHDGTKLAFESDRGHTGDGDIYVMNYDGSGVRQLTNDASNDRQPSWSPDGRKIAFYRDGGIWVMSSADGSGQTSLTPTGAHPSWSPDGSKFVFAGPSGHIWVMNADGSGLTPLTSAPGFDDTPVWSPDSRRIAFQHTPTQSNLSGIYLMTADGTGITQLTHGGQTPVWSPDGTEIVYEFLGLNIINADGTGPARLGTGFTPTWSPVGTVPPRPAATRTLTIASGDGQTDTLLATLPLPLNVRVLDQQGIPVPGVEVIWIPEGQGGIEPSVSTRFNTTDATGIASVSLTLGDRLGPTTVQAEVMDGTVRSAGVMFTATTTAGRPTTLTGTGPLSNFVVVGSTNTYSAIARDSHGNAAAGVPIAWAVTGGGAIAQAQDSTTLQPSGAVSSQAEVTFGPSEGSVVVTATAPTIAGAPQVSFATTVVTAIVAVGGRTITTGACLQSFRPANITVAAGRSVAWVWSPCLIRRSMSGGTLISHNVTFEDDSTKHSPTQSSGTYSRTFSAPGVYRYRCTLHSTDFATGEVGTITVK